MSQPHASPSPPPVGPDCPTCGAATRGARGTPVEFADPSGEVAARLEGVVTWECDRGHRRVVDDDLAARLDRAVDAQLVVARRRRLRRDEVCGVCGVPLTLPGRRTETPVVDDTGPSVVTLSPTMPMVRCPDCSTEQVPAGAADDLRSLFAPMVSALATDDG